jgi:NADH-quinone oxidoreductase subunit L
MVGPLVVLAIGAAFAGLAGLPGGLVDHPTWNLLEDALAPVLGPEMEISSKVEVGVMVGATLSALLGIGLAWLFFGGGWREPAVRFAAAFPKLVRLVRDKFRIDELYDLLIIRPLRRFAQGLYFVVDRVIIDKILVEGVAGVVGVFSRIARLPQSSGDGQGYMAVFAFGVAGLVYFVSRQSLSSEGLKVSINGRSVDVDVRRGGRAGVRPMEYSFDFDDDGKPEVTGASAAASHVYPRPGRYTIRVEVKDTRWGTTDSVEQKVEVR